MKLEKNIADDQLQYYPDCKLLIQAISTIQKINYNDKTFVEYLVTPS